MFRLRSWLSALLVWLVLANDGAALEVRQTLWGFDGRAVPGRINPVSLLIANPGQRPFDGDLLLRQASGLGGHAGAPFVQPAYLAPGSERWVQFQVYVDNSGADYFLTWGRGAKERFEFDGPATGPPARVLLNDEANPFAASGPLKLFPDQLFPTTVAATDGLNAVVLDYVPRWEPARREAFVDWLKRGGLVLVLPGQNGEFPIFTEQLAVLNIEGESGRVGAGTVLRTKATRREAGEATFVQLGYAAPTLKTAQTVAVFSFEQTLFERLAQLTRPNIQWWLINLLTVVYLLLIGPVHYRWGRRFDYRASIGAFLATVALFGWIFSVVGRRGYGESQTVHSLAIARSLGGARHDVSQWISAFATRGDLYTLTHEAPANLYAAVSMEPINGRIFNGKNGQFVADIPLYSARQFLHRAAMTGDDTSVTVEAWETAGDRLKKLVLQVGPNFPAEVIELRVRYRDLHYALQREGDRLVLALSAPQTFEEFVTRERVMNIGRWSGAAKLPDEETEDFSATAVQRSLPLLYVQAMDGREYFQHHIAEAPRPGERLTLYIFAPAPESFRLRGEGFARENGSVLYVQQISKP